MSVRAQGLEGGAGPWVQSQGGRAHAQKLVKSTNGWERVAVDLDVPAESNLIVLGATLEGGGTKVFQRQPEKVDLLTLMDPAAVPDAVAMGQRQATADVAELRTFLR